MNAIALFCEQNMSYVIGNNKKNIYGVKANDATGQMAWYIMKIPPLKKQLFLKALEEKEMDMTDYGTILYSGYGEEVSQNVKDHILQQYGIDL